MDKKEWQQTIVFILVVILIMVWLYHCGDSSTQQPNLY